MHAGREGGRPAFHLGNETLSRAVQAVVSKGEMRRLLPDDSPRSLTLATLLLADVSSWYVWLALLVTLSNGLIGFLDDSAKVRRRNSVGLPAARRIGHLNA